MANVPTENAEQVPTMDHQQLAHEDEIPALAESKMPTRKDISLKEFLTKMDDYAPIVCLNLSLPVPSELALTLNRFRMLSSTTTLRRPACHRRPIPILALRI